MDPLLLVAIGANESALGNAYAPSFNAEHHNPFGLSAQGQIIAYPDWKSAIRAVCTTATKLSGGNNSLQHLGSHYASDPEWPNKVGRFYNHYLTGPITQN